VVFAIGLCLTSGSLALLDALTIHPARALELGVLVVANLVATGVRFLMMRIWVFRTAGTSA
jgi:hypothetical protein